MDQLWIVQTKILVYPVSFYFVALYVTECLLIGTNKSQLSENRMLHRRTTTDINTDMNTIGSREYHLTAMLGESKLESSINLALTKSSWDLQFSNIP